MKTNKEIRKATKQTAKGRWFWRIFFGTFLLQMFTIVAMKILNAAFTSCSIMTLNDYAAKKIQAAQAGLNWEPSTLVSLLSMFGASVFNVFVQLILGAIVMFGMIVLVMKAVRNDENRLVASSLEGFKRPLELAWLLFYMNLKIVLWSLLFFIPGLIAMYAYRQSFYLKNDHPDWSASKCIAESKRMMKGYKWQSMCLDASYFWGFLVAGMITTIPVGIGLGGMCGEVSICVEIILAAALAVAFYIMIKTTINMIVSRGVFYESLKFGV